MEKHIHIHLHRRSADRKTKDTSLELALATKEVRRLQNAGVTGHYVVLQRVMRMLMGQGFGEQYAQKVAEEAMDLMSSAADAHFTQYDPREAHRLDDEIREVEQQIAKHKARPTPPPITIRDLEQVLAKLKRERAKYHDAAHDSKLEDLERQLDELETQIEKLEDTGQSPSRALLDQRKTLQNAIAVIKSARKNVADADQVYRGYTIRNNTITGDWFIIKSGTTISRPNDLDDAKRKIDELVELGLDK